MGTLILADLIGARSCIFIKDEKGLYTDDPNKNPETEFIEKIGALELMRRDQDDLIIERPCLEILQNSQVINPIQIINVPGGGKYYPSPQRGACRNHHL